MRRLRRHGGPIVVWCLTVVVVVVMLERRTVVVEAMGLAEAASVTVSPLEVGQVASVEVKLLQDVRRGQVLVRMDDARLRAEAAVVVAEVAALRADLEMDDADRRLTETADLRRFTADVEDARLRRLEILAELEPDRITLADLDREVASYRSLLDSEMVSVREFERVEAEHGALAGRVAELESMLTTVLQDLAAAEQRRGEFLRQRPEIARQGAATEAVAARIAVLERRLEEVGVRRDDLTLTAPFDGVVTQIPACAGQVVRPGDPVLTLAAARVEQIVVWLDESELDRVRRRGDVEATVVHTVGGRHEHVRCPVLRIGPTVVQVPEDLWPSPTQPQRGRPVVLGIRPGMELAPGEIVTVRWG
jgi:membrane fusion protein (multidrug efflux system)